MEWLKELLENKTNVETLVEQIKTHLPNHFISEDKYNNKIEEVKVLNSTLLQRNNDIKELKKADPKDLQKALQTLQTTYVTEKETWEKTLKDSAIKSAVKMSINNNVYDVDVALSLMDLSKIEVDELGNIKKGLDEQIGILKENKSYLFKTEQNNTGRTPADSSSILPSSNNEESQLRAAMGLSPSND